MFDIYIICGFILVEFNRYFVFSIFYVYVLVVVLIYERFMFLEYLCIYILLFIFDLNLLYICVI